VMDCFSVPSSATPHAMAAAVVAADCAEFHATLLADTRYELGEGALWHEGRLLHVDIEGKLVGVLDPESGSVTTCPVPSRVGTVVPVRGSRTSVVVCLEEGVCILDLDSGELEQLAPFPAGEREGMRFNDGKCDPNGDLWVGTMMIAEPRLPVGTLYRVRRGAESSWSLEPMLTGTTISNGIVWLDDKTMLYIDSATRRLDRVVFDWGKQSVASREALFEFPPEDGWPDGCALDTHGRVWVAHFGGGQVTCIDPPSKSLVARVRLPGGVTNATSVAFGRDDMYITTAREGLSERELEEQPTAGGVFVVRGVGSGVVATTLDVE
jgi:sugar lactone lactonase YvrE